MVDVVVVVVKVVVLITSALVVVWIFKLFKSSTWSTLFDFSVTTSTPGSMPFLPLTSWMTFSSFLLSLVSSSSDLCCSMIFEGLMEGLSSSFFRLFCSTPFRPETEEDFGSVFGLQLPFRHFMTVSVWIFGGDEVVGWKSKLKMNLQCPKYTETNGNYLYLIIILIQNWRCSRNDFWNQCRS